MRKESKAIGGYTMHYMAALHETLSQKKKQKIDRQWQWSKGDPDLTSQKRAASENWTQLLSSLIENKPQISCCFLGMGGIVACAKGKLLRWRQGQTFPGV